jgi:hypothetical protein
MYSYNLQRNINVPINLLNQTDVAEFQAATARFYDTPAAEIRRLSNAGDMDARYIIEMAAGEGEIAAACREYLL